MGGVSNCRSCGAEIYFQETKAGKYMPVDPETGVTHFATCPYADRHRKPREHDLERETAPDGAFLKGFEDGGE